MPGPSSGAGEAFVSKRMPTLGTALLPGCMVPELPSQPILEGEAEQAGSHALTNTLS